ncbi:hypothetical protein V8D89_012508 [Ganoderma adspersum]
MLASAMLSVPDQMLARDYVRELGSANIFSVKTLDQLEFGVPQGEEGSCYARTEVCYLEEDLSNLDLILGVLIDWVENTTVFDPFEYFEIREA